MYSAFATIVSVHEFETLMIQNPELAYILKGVFLLSLFLIIIVLILIYILFISVTKQSQLRQKNQELALLRTPIYSNLIDKNQSKINQLTSDSADKETTIDYLKEKTDRLTYSIYSKCAAWPKINALQSGNLSEKTPLAVDRDKMRRNYQLNSAERDSLLEFIHLCRDDIPVPHSMLTDDELILFHLLTTELGKAEIAILTGVSDGTLRQRKFRLLRKIEELSSTNG